MLRKSRCWKPRTFIPINLDRPSDRQPALVEGRYGKQGRTVAHTFDTPDDANGKIFYILWKYLSGSEALNRRNKEVRKIATEQRNLGEIMTTAEDLISFGERNFSGFGAIELMLSGSGALGLEYCTLYVMIKAAADFFRKHPLGILSSATGTLLSKTCCSL